MIPGPRQLWGPEWLPEAEVGGAPFLPLSRVPLGLWSSGRPLSCVQAGPASFRS